MKRRSILSKLMVMTMAAALVFGNGAATLTVHATDDGCYHGNGRENGGSSPSDGSDDIGGGSSSDSGSSSGGGESYSALSSGGGSSDGGSGDSGSGYSGGGESYSAPSGDSGNGSNGGGAATAPSGLATKGNTATIPGSQTFRQVNKPADGRAAIYHCGIEQYTAQLMDADGNAAAYKYASPYKDEATGKWYLNIITEDGVDTKGYTIGTYKGSVTYLPKLGMSGVMLNQTVMVDAEAAAAAETAAK